MSGRLTLAAVHLQAGETISSISWHSATTALASGTNQWFGLFDSSRVALRLTNDDTSGAWVANAGKTLSLTSPFVTTYTGIHYIGIMVAATTVPSLFAFSGNATIQAIAPATAGTADTGLTTPPSLPFTAAALTVGGAIPFGWCS